MLPSALTRSMAVKLSLVVPYSLDSTPIPPPSASPAIPTVGQEPPGTATPLAARLA